MLFRCMYCGETYKPTVKQINDRRRNINTNTFCSLTCSGKYAAHKSHKGKTEKQEQERRDKISKSLKATLAKMTDDERKKFSEGGKKFWDNKTYEERSQINKQRAVVSKQTKLEKYGNENYNNKEQTKKTNLEKYGVKCTLQCKKAVINKSYKQKQINKKIHTIKQEQFNNTHYKKQVLNKMKNTSMQRYNAPNYVLSDRFVKEHPSVVSKINKEWSKFLDIKQLEKGVGNYRYDLCHNNILIDINPTVSHNTIESFGYHLGITKENNPVKITYHLDRYKNAIKNNYRVINVFDWDNKNKIKNLLCEKQKLYANQFTVQTVDKETGDIFIIENDIKELNNNNNYIGLFKDNKLYSLVGFNKHTRTKAFEYEINNMCTLPQFEIVGGYNKMFYFIKQDFNINRLCYYLDINKLDYKYFKQLGFKCRKKLAPIKHWSKGTLQVQTKDPNKEKKLLEDGYLPVYDCGLYLLYIDL